MASIQVKIVWNMNDNKTKTLSLRNETGKWNEKEEAYPRKEIIVVKLMEPRFEFNNFRCNGHTQKRRSGHISTGYHRNSRDNNIKQEK